MDVATKQYVDTAVAGAGGSVYEVEYVTYNSSTSAEIETAYQDGKTVFVVIDDQAAQIYPLTERRSETEHSFTGYDPTLRAPVEISCYNNTWSTTALPALPTPTADSTGQVL
jgi:phosphatidylserine/phosphatidylglycerophosphate/cardiolipin synthase-like enzyme